MARYAIYKNGIQVAEREAAQLVGDYIMNDKENASSYSCYDTTDKKVFYRWTKYSVDSFGSLIGELKFNNTPR